FGVNERSGLFALHHFDYLHRAGALVRDKLAPLCPAIGIVVMPDIGEQVVIAIAPQDYPQIPRDTRRPDLFIARSIEPLETAAGALRVDHQIYRGDLDLLL